jgi:hypothetical protein
MLILIAQTYEEHNDESSSNFQFQNSGGFINQALPVKSFERLFMATY